MKLVVHPHYLAARPFFASLPEQFGQGGELIYQKRNIVKRFHTPQGEWIVKRYKDPNLIQRLAYTFWRSSKAARAYHYAGRLQSMGIDTPEGVAYIEIKKGLLFKEGYFVSLPCPYPSVKSALVERPVADAPRLIEALVAFIADMHRKGFLHGDLNLSNLLYHSSPEGRYCFTVIDTNRSHFHPSPSRKECLENLKRLTHDRLLLQQLVRAYAVVRGWETETCVRQVIESVERFEKRNALKKLKIKS